MTDTKVSSSPSDCSYSPSRNSLSSSHLQKSKTPNSNSNSNTNINSLNDTNSNIDYNAINKYLNNGKDSLKSHGGDITRNLYVLSSQNEQNESRRKRSSSFSNYFDQTRTSSVSEMNLPGGFRRDFLKKNSSSFSHSIHRKPNNFVTRNFLEFLSIYGHFAGETLDEDFTQYNESYSAILDEESQLLPTDSYQQHHGTASSMKTFFLLFKSLVGSGVLFLPKAFLNGGLLFSSVVLFIFGMLTFFCYFVLIESKLKSNLNSFGELGNKACGNILRFSILFSIILSQVGFVSSYIIFVCENLISFISQFFSIGSKISISKIIFVQFICLIPLVLLRDLTKLSVTSLISSACILFGLIIISYYSGTKIIHEGISDIKPFNPNSWSMLIGVAVTAFEGVGLILPIQSSMAQPQNFNKILFLTMACITFLFIFIGFIGYSAFGSDTMTIIILNLPSEKLSVSSIKVLYSLAVFLTAPLQLFPVIKILESFIFNNSILSGSGKNNLKIKWSKNILRIVTVLLVSVLAYYGSGNLDKFVSFNGCFACIPLVYIYPPLIHLRLFKDSKNKYLILDYFIITVGVMAVFYTTFQILAFN